MAFAALIETPLGPLRAEADDRAITALNFDAPPLTDTASNPILEKLRAELAEYFAGQRNDFTVQLSPAGTDFQRRVWSELCRIPHSQTISYEELANRIGKPTAQRAVAQANGANPIVILIPCHRVINKSGRLGGYSSGLERKRFLLGLERGDAIDTKDFTLQVEECSC
jgi:methylated-DNA-[protein]-cysteine S-methyltransferase